MTIPTDIKREKATHKPTMKDLILAPPTFFCFSANPQLAHFASPNTQADASACKKAKFLLTHTELSNFAIWMY
jgi:hypothetical protein